MPGERRNLRSNKDTSSETNGEKAQSSSQNSSSKDKPVPTRSTSSKGKTASAKRDKAQANGAPVENGVNGADDVEMVDDGPEQVKINGKDGDEEMTVVVPPPNSSKLAGEPSKDTEGDVAMDTTDAATKDEAIDPRVKAVSGQSLQWALRSASNRHLHQLTFITRYQSKLHSAGARSTTVRCPFHLASPPLHLVYSKAPFT